MFLEFSNVLKYVPIIICNVLKYAFPIINRRFVQVLVHVYVPLHLYNRNHKL
jgi:hypothetical protein